MQTSVKRQRLLNIALLGIIVAGGFIAAVRPAGDATFDTITCKEWRVVDKHGMVRIAAAANAADGYAGVAWLDKDEKVRIRASTTADGSAGGEWRDKDGKVRITAATLADGTVFLPTTDENPPKKP